MTTTTTTFICSCLFSVVCVLTWPCSFNDERVRVPMERITVCVVRGSISTFVRRRRPVNHSDISSTTTNTTVLCHITQVCLLLLLLPVNSRVLALSVWLWKSFSLSVSFVNSSTRGTGNSSKFVKSSCYCDVWKKFSAAELRIVDVWNSLSDAVVKSTYDIATFKNNLTVDLSRF